jgi:hypothetical protein
MAVCPGKEISVIESSKALDVIRTKSRELDEILANPDTPVIHALLVLQELRTATGILRSSLLDQIDD